MAEIVFENLSKRFTTKDGTVEALKNINLSIEKGDIYGIIGMSGAGKSTLVRCINLLERPTEGKVYVEGEELTAMSPKELRQRRKKIGMIFQQFNLFAARTVYENIAFPLRKSKLSKKEKQEKVKQLLKLVELEEKADVYPSQLSGGQKQRLSIARAIAKHPDVYIFDDSFSALDYKTDAVLRKELKAKTKDSTVMIAAQRISTILHAEQIIVLDDGQIVGKGTHKELLKSCEAYYQIASSQLSEKELEADMKEVD